MNLYDRTRWFGELPELPADSCRRDTDRILSELKKRWQDEPDRSGHLAALFAYALAFSRLDALSGFLTPDDWDHPASALLHRGHLKFYRAMAENPDSPESRLLSDAAADFREAAADSECAPEAYAALIRLTAVEAGSRRAMAQMRRLERFRFTPKAAVGARLFLADLPGTSDRVRKRHLLRARRHLRSSGATGDALLLRASVEYRLDRPDRAVDIWRRLADAGSGEAWYRLLEYAATEGRLSESQDRRETGRLLARLRKYRDAFPMDPRSYMLEGELLLPEDAEAARMAWRGALVIDDRHAPAWARLGDLYRDAWERREDEYGGSWLEAAADSYLKAASLAPLEGRYRILVGLVEREAGRPARAVGSLTGALALEREDPETRRLLALAWTDLAYSAELTPESKSAAAGRARKEWMRLLERGQRRLFDVIGLCRAVALQSIAPGGLSADSAALLDTMASDIIREVTPELAEELLPLAEDYLAAGLHGRIPGLLNAAEKHLGERPRILALWAAVTPEDDAAEAIRLYMAAADASGPENPDFPEWIRRAASVSSAAGWHDGAVGILQTALENRPEDRMLLRELAGLLDRLNRPGDALELFRNAMRKDPMDGDLLDDAVWFARESGKEDEAGAFLREALEMNPDNGRAWNQLGVFLMETGWEDSEDGIPGMNPAALEEALAAYRQAVEADAGNNVYRGNLGDALRQAGKWTEAFGILEDIVSGFPESGPEVRDAFVLNSLARLEDERSYAAEGSESSMEDWESAGGHYRMAAGADPENTDFLRDHAWWLYRERRLEEALTKYRQAARLDPTDETLPYGEFSCLKELGEETEAMKALDRALAIQPDNPEMGADKAELLGLLGETDRAAALFQRIVDLTDGAFRIRERLAVFLENAAHLHTGQPEYPHLSSDGILADKPSFVPDHRDDDAGRLLVRALEAWMETESAGSGDRRIAGRIGGILALLGRRDEAEVRLLASLEHSAADAEALNLLGRLSMDRGRMGGADAAHLDSAEKYLVAAADRAPQRPEYLAHAAYLYTLKGVWTTALRYFTEALGRDGEETLWLANAGITALRAGEYELAARHLQKAVDGKDEPEWQNALGLALLYSGSSELAARAFRSACLLEPANSSYLANLEMAYRGAQYPDAPIQ